MVMVKGPRPPPAAAPAVRAGPRRGRSRSAARAFPRRRPRGRAGIRGGLGKMEMDGKVEKCMRFDTAARPLQAHAPLPHILPAVIHHSLFTCPKWDSARVVRAACQWGAERAERENSSGHDRRQGGAAGRLGRPARAGAGGGWHAASPCRCRPRARGPRQRRGGNH